MKPALATEEKSVRATRRAILMVALLVTPVALYLGFASAGFGEGNYVIARLLLPFACIAVALTPEASGNTSAVLGTSAAILQFPLYGVILANAARRYTMKQRAIILTIVHALVVISLFTFLKGPFS